MGFADQYLLKQKGFSPFITVPPSENLRFTIVIPAYCEPFLQDTLNSIWNCNRPKGHVEVIIVVNSPENADPEVIECNMVTIRVVSEWIRDHHDPALRFFLIEMLRMPATDAGVGLARKTGMDEAISRFNRIRNPNGFILSFDADSRCDTNYLICIEESISRNPLVKGFTVYFEHPVSGPDYPDRVYEGIIDYELHMRYVNMFLRFAGFPFAFHTIGSCFGVRADVYTAQGGMNKRKAGEDFYFLHKIIPLGQFLEINTTRVIPSPRESDRVPFGTGTAISKYLTSAATDILTYSPECFLTLKSFFGQTGDLYNINPSEIDSFPDQLALPLKTYLQDIGFGNAVTEINANCRTPGSFLHRFYRWFDAFKIIKYLNFASRGYYEQVPVREAVLQFLQEACIRDLPESVKSYDLLMLLRRIERGGNMQ